MLNVRGLAVTAVLCVVLLASVSGGANAQILNLTQWALADGGNDHWYGVMAGQLEGWDEARARGESQVLDGYYGYLATVTSQSENDFLYSSVLAGVVSNVHNNFWLGGLTTLPPHNPNGVWMTGETWTYENWGEGMPDDDGPRCITIRGEFTPPYYPPPATWDDVYSKESNFTFGVVEWGEFGRPYDPTPEVPEPAYLTFGGLGLCGLVAWRKRAKRGV